jgi:hypothetical protein
MSTLNAEIAAEIPRAPSASTAPIRRTAGLTVLVICAILLSGSAISKFAHVPGVVRQMAASGFAGPKLTLIASLELLGAMLFLLPRTRSLGLLMVSAYLGGAICAHVQGGDYPHAAAPSILLSVVWIGTALRHPGMLWSLSSSPDEGEPAARNALDSIEPDSITAPTKWSWAARLSRLIMILPLAIMLRISVHYIADPSHAAAATGVSLSTPEALTDTRVVGGLTLTIAAVIAAAIFSRRRLRFGHAIVAVMMGTILAIRLFGFAHDGTTLAMGDQMRKTIGEIIFLVLNTIGFVAYSRRRFKRAKEQAS